MSSPAVTVSGPGEGSRYPCRYFIDRLAALNAARSTAITLASRAAHRGDPAGSFYVRDPEEKVYCRVDWDESGVVQVVMS